MAKPEILFDDTYKGERYTYGLTYRPVGYAQIPEGWIIKSDKLSAKFSHGTIDYPRQLTQKEIAQYQLTPITPKPVTPKAPVTPKPKAGKLISQKQVKVDVINKAIARSAYAREKGVYAELRKDGIIEYSRIYPERPESRMKISFMEMLNTLEGEDIRHLHKLYSTKEIVKLPKRKVPRVTQKTPKLRR